MGKTSSRRLKKKLCRAGNSKRRQFMTCTFAFIADSLQAWPTARTSKLLL